MLHVTCPKCGSGFDVDDNLKGTKAQCGKCGVCFVVTENGGATLLLPSILPDSGVQGATTNATVTAGPSAPAQPEYGATSGPSSTIGETDLDQHSSATGEEPLPNSLLSEPAPDACGDTFTEESIDIMSDCTRIEIYRTVYFITYFSGVVCFFGKHFSKQFF